MENDPKELVRHRIREELRRLSEGTDIKAELISENDQDYVIYHDLETSGGSKDLPAKTDVLVAVPEGYPSSLIDMPALPLKSALVSLVAGGLNPQAIVTFQGQEWRFLSFHPYTSVGGPSWNPIKHGFHDYYQHLYSWLHKV
jgi:hypothetical protein